MTMKKSRGVHAGEEIPLPAEEDRSQGKPESSLLELVPTSPPRLMKLGTLKQPAKKQHTAMHRGEPVAVGDYTVYLGGTRYLQRGDVDGMDILVPLTEVPVAFASWHQVTGQVIPLDPYLFPPIEPGSTHTVLAAPLENFGGVPKGWESFLRGQIIPLLKAGKKLLIFCVGSHGRTGTFVASLIALLEPDCPDPIAAARKRHCFKAVEGLQQARAIFALRKERLPEKYRREFAPKKVQARGY